MKAGARCGPVVTLKLSTPRSKPRGMSPTAFLLPSHHEAHSGHAEQRGQCLQALGRVWGREGEREGRGERGGVS